MIMVLLLLSKEASSTITIMNSTSRYSSRCSSLGLSLTNHRGFSQDITSLPGLQGCDASALLLHLVQEDSWGDFTGAAVAWRRQHILTNSCAPLFKEIPSFSLCGDPLATPCRTQLLKVAFPLGKQRSFESQERGRGRWRGGKKEEKRRRKI